MAIYSLKGDIFELAPAYSECAALWLRHGFNMRYTTWWRNTKVAPYVLTSINAPHVSRQSPVLISDRPWESDTDLVLELTPHNQLLKYLYIFSNPKNAHGVESLLAVQVGVQRCLDAVLELGLYSIAFIHIPVLFGDEPPTEQDDMKSAQAMIDAIQQWQSTNSSYSINVFLADLGGHFERLVDAAPEPDQINR